MIEKIEVTAHYDSSKEGNYFLAVTIDGEEFPWNKDLMQVEVPGTRFDDCPSIVITLCAKTVDVHHSIDRPLPEPATETPAAAISAKPGPEYVIAQLTPETFNDLAAWTNPDKIWGLEEPHPSLFLNTLHGRKNARMRDWITYTPAEGFNVLTPTEAWKQFQVFGPTE